MGATLVDAAGPGSEAATVSTLAEVGVGMGNLRRIALTHQDLDHVGSLSALARASGARCWHTGQRRPSSTAASSRGSLSPPCHCRDVAPVE
jgi:glyoxylase-like metal-dependent hydrolase (beta-lactamase superfamily II)